MIAQICLTLDFGDRPCAAPTAYALYSWLLTTLSREDGQRLHENGMRPVSQHLRLNGDARGGLWVVNLLGEEAVSLLLPPLERAQTLTLHGRGVRCAGRTVTRIESPQALPVRRRQSRFTFELATPCAFRRNDRYVTFPDPWLVLRSLAARWAICFGEPLLDGEQLDAAAQGLHLTDYALRTSRFPLKRQASIPCFEGLFTLEADLPPEQMQAVRALHAFAPYAGLGIKTALGMGGVRRG